ncbi:MAG: rhodanese [Rhodospirillaceae bacterium]|nr:MAG: rhodanese [Rhodospirillaceae bacterium]
MHKWYVHVLATAAIAVATAFPAWSQEVRITPDMAEATIQTADGPVVIKRDQNVNATIDPEFAKTSRTCPPFCIQPHTVTSSVATVAELEVIALLKEGKGVLVDARTQDFYLRGTIPGAISIPYTEIASHLDKLGCTKAGEKWECGGAKTTALFCNGPWCGQSPAAIKAMLAVGFPAERILYYRDGMQAWKSLGLTTVEGLP